MFSVDMAEPHSHPDGSDLKAQFTTIDTPWCILKAVLCPSRPGLSKRHPGHIKARGYVQPPFPAASG